MTGPEESVMPRFFKTKFFMVLVVLMIVFTVVCLTILFGVLIQSTDKDNQIGILGLFYGLVVKSLLLGI